MIRAFTSAAPNYIGKVRVLSRSLKEHCPSVDLHWLVADQRSHELASYLRRHEIDGNELAGVTFVDDVAELSDPSWLFQHDMVELSTAIKGDFARKLLTDPLCDGVIYLDPDQVVFSSLEDLFDHLRSAAAIVTPHLLGPYPESKAIRDHEICCLRHGVFNLGFLGIRDCDEGQAFLAWWSDRCLRFCQRDWRVQGLFTDQKWVDLAPLFFPGIAISREPRFNVAPWNIARRNLDGSFDTGFTVNGAPLGFYHFTGLDSGAHRQVLDHYAPGNRAAQSLIAWYEKKTAEMTPNLDLGWRLGTYHNGRAIEASHRRIYREREDLREIFANPFATDPEGGYLRWLRTTGTRE